MKKSSFISVLRRVALFALIFIVSFALSVINFIAKSDSFCSLGIKTACETYLVSAKWKKPDFLLRAELFVHLFRLCHDGFEFVQGPVDGFRRGKIDACVL